MTSPSRPTIIAIAGSVALATFAAGVFLPTALAGRPSAVLDLPPTISSAVTATAALSGGAVLELQGTDLDELTDVEVGGVRADLTVTSKTTATVVVPPAAEGKAGVAPVEAWDGALKLDTDKVQVAYEVQTPVDLQLQYAFAHWNNYNLAEYGDFNAWGGDCINFVSQTLVARGWQPTEEWFNNAQEEWAPAFVHVPSFDEWLRSHPEYGATTLTLDQRDQVKIGDVVLFDWEGDGSLDHAQVVSRVTTLANGAVKIQMVGHNLDSTYRDLDQALATQGTTGATAYFWSIP